MERKLIVEFTVPLDPVTKKNSQRIMVNRKTGRAFIMPSEKYKNYEKLSMSFIPHLDSPIENEIEVECKFYMRTRRAIDLTNLLEAIDDVMVKGGVISDDNSKVIFSHDGSRVFYDKDNPRTEVKIYAYL